MEFGFFEQYIPPHRGYLSGRIAESGSNAKSPHAEIDVMVHGRNSKDASHLLLHLVSFNFEGIFGTRFVQLRSFDGSNRDYRKALEPGPWNIAIFGSGAEDHCGRQKSINLRSSIPRRRSRSSETTYQH